MPPDFFLHERSDFKALVETVADSEKINDPALVEKDYWITICLTQVPAMSPSRAQTSTRTFTTDDATSLGHRLSDDISKTSALKLPVTPQVTGR